jgi:hypothetical protein
MPTKQFKDFSKESKDLLTKNFPVPGSWKVEVKGKGGDREPILSQVNAIYSEKVKGIDVDVDYNLKQFNLKTKTNVNAAGIIKPKVTYEPAVGHKVEATLNSLSVDSDFELAYEGEFAAGVAVHDKVTKKGGMIQAAYPLGNVTVGASVAYAFQSGLINWAAGFRYADKNLTAGFSTTDLKTYNTHVFFPFTCPLTGCKLLSAAAVDCGHNKWSGAATVEAPLECLGLPKTSARVKLTNDLAATVSLITKVAQNWTAVVTVNVQNVTKFGVQLTRE